MFAVRDRDAAETITQECFLKAYRARESFRGDCSLSTWLMQIAVNLVRDYARSKQFQFWKRAQTSAVDVSEVTEFLKHPGSSAEAGVLAREQLKAVWAAVEKLSKMQREVFLATVCGRDGTAGDCGADGDERKYSEVASLSGPEFSADASACGNGWSAMKDRQIGRSREHLTAKEISRWLVEGPEQSADQHVQNCWACQAKLAEAQAPLTAFRIALVNWSEAQAATRPLSSNRLKAGMNATGAFGSGFRRQLWRWLALLLVGYAKVPGLFHGHSSARSATAVGNRIDRRRLRRGSPGPGRYRGFRGCPRRDGAIDRPGGLGFQRGILAETTPTEKHATRKTSTQGTNAKTHVEVAN